MSSPLPSPSSSGDESSTIGKVHGSTIGQEPNVGDHDSSTMICSARREQEKKTSLLSMAFEKLKRCRLANDTDAASKSALIVWGLILGEVKEDYGREEREAVISKVLSSDTFLKTMSETHCNISKSDVAVIQSFTEKSRMGLVDGDQYCRDKGEVLISSFLDNRPEAVSNFKLPYLSLKNAYMLVLGRKNGRSLEEVTPLFIALRHLSTIES